MITKEEIATKLAEQKKKILKKHADLINDLTNLKDAAKEENKTLYRKSDPSLEVLFTPEQIQQQYEQIIDILNKEHKDLSDALAQIMDDDPSHTEKITNEIKKIIGFRYRTGHKYSKYPNLTRTFCIYVDTDKQYKIAVTFGSKNANGNKDKHNDKASGSYKQVRTGTSIIFSTSKLEHVAKISMSKQHYSVFAYESKIFEKIPKEICPFRFVNKQGAFFSLDHKVGKEITFFVPEAKYDLFHELTKYGLTHERKVYIFAKLLHDLCKLHENLISHRDIKLENVFIGYNSIPYFGDYGFSGVGVSSQLCTLDYSSPRISYKCKELIDAVIQRQGIKIEEQETQQKFVNYFSYLNDNLDKNEILSQSDNPFADDIWAIGVMYYICLAGKDPKDDMRAFKTAIQNDVFLSAVLSINERQRPNANQALLLLTAQFLAQDNINNNLFEEYLLSNFGGREQFSNELAGEMKRILESNYKTELDLKKIEIYHKTFAKVNIINQSESKRMR